MTWEKTIQTNIGVDYALFNSRLYGSVDVFREDTESQLLDIQIPADAGYTSITGNIGNVRNEGIEVEVGAG